MAENKIPEEAMLVAGNAGDKQFIESPNKWPRWPFCPMRKRDEKEHFSFRIGLLVETGEPNWKSTIYLDVNMYNQDMNLKEAEKKTYSSVDEMQADGWIVD